VALEPKENDERAEYNLQMDREMNVNEQLVQSLLFEEESTTLDFKRDQYNFVGANDTEKSEILKDILAFANAWRRADAYIIIGIKELKGGEKSVVGIAEFLDDAQLQQFVNSKTQKPLSFSYQNLKFKGADIAVIHIPVQERPFYINKDYGKLNKNTVYIRRGSATAQATPDEIATMRLSSYIESNATAPKLSVSFLLPTRGDTQQLKVLSREKLVQAKVLTQLNALVLRSEDVDLVKKHSEELGSIKDRYPSGKEFPAFPVEDVNDFLDKILNAIKLATDDFEEFINRYELASRSYELFNNGISKMLRKRGIHRPYAFINLLNTGTSPAEGIIVYIKGSSKIRFLKRELLQNTTIRLYPEVPEYVMKVILQATKIDLGLTEPFITMYERTHKRKFNSRYNFDSTGISMPTIPSRFPDPYRCSVKENKLKISVRDDLMHNHDFEIDAEPFCLCPLLDLGEMVDLEYEVHAKNLPQPSSGRLLIEGVKSLGEG
jgi:hypothetical protein